MREETGLTVRFEHLIGTYGLESGFTASAFRCSIVGDRTPTVPDTAEIAEIAWWPAGALPTPRSNALHYALPDAVAGCRGAVRHDLPRVS